MRLAKIFGAACVVALGASSAMASSVTFNFDTTAPDSPGGNKWTDASGVSVTAFASTNLGLASAVLTVGSTYGLGVRTTDAVGSNPGTDLIDGAPDPAVGGFTFKEKVILTFSPNVDLTSITFSMVDGAPDSSNSNPGDDIVVTYNGGSATLDPLSGSGDQKFSFPGGAQGPITVVPDGINDSFGIRSVTVNYVNPSITAVPVPASVWSGLSLMAGLAVRKIARRRKLA
jgi:hypothetical protein